MFSNINKNDTKKAIKYFADGLKALSSSRQIWLITNYEKDRRPL
jgi:hypothetical protein